MNVSKRTFAAMAVLALALVMALPVFAGGGGQAAASTTPYIAVVSKGEQHDFWRQVRLGAEAAATELGVEISFEGPPSEADVNIQVEMLTLQLLDSQLLLPLQPWTPTL